MTNNDSIIDSLKSTLKEINSINEVIGKFNDVMDELGSKLNDILDTGKKEEIILISEYTNEALKHMNERYKEFLDSNNITEELDTKISEINQSLIEIQNETVNINKEISSIKNKFNRNNGVLLDKINNYIDSNNKSFNEELVRTMSSNVEILLSNEINTLKRDLRKDITNSIKSSNQIPSISKEIDNLPGRAFLYNNYLYYISEINGNKIHRYNIIDNSDECFDVLNNLDENINEIKFPPTLKISYFKRSDGEEYICGISKDKRSLFCRNLKTGQVTELLRYCIDYAQIGNYIYALAHNSIIKVSMEKLKKQWHRKLISSDAITKGSIGALKIIGDNLFLTFNNYNFIVDVENWDIISLF